MLYMGTFVSSGSCKAIVVSTGQSTVVGKLAKDIQQIKPGKTHFQKKSDLLAKQLGIIATVGAILTFLIGYFIRGLEFNEIFLFTIATLVSAIPEGLPAVLAIVLAIGAYRMSKKNALVRKLPSTETLGVVTTIITDKTGTLTENTMNVEKIILPGYPEISVTGSGWEPQGSFVQNKKNITPLENPQLSKLLHIATSCNASKILKEKNKYSIIGDPTEAALLVLAEKAGLKKDSLKEKTLDDLPFNPEVKFRASLSSEKDQKKVCVMGAPEAILSRSSHILKNGTKTQINLKLGEEISTQINSLTKKAMRVIALAYVDTKTESLTEKSVKDLVFVGLVGIRDPPRSEVSEAIDKAKHAGIRVIMATGDHKETALAIAKDIGLISKSENKVLTGQELEKLSKTEFTKTVRNTQVFARLTPNMKLKIATELQSQGEVIAMTGDGVNDAPALKKADVGISMGIIGTDVARDSSDIVLADDNFASIVNAIEEGRIVFMNTRQASAFLITTNIAELIVILITLTLRLPLPFLPIQILWINLVTGGGTDISLATETHKDHILSKKPRKAKENIFTKEMMPFLTLISAVIIVTTFFIFMLYLPQGIEKARTGAFVLISFTELFNVYNMRSLTKSIFKIGVFSNKWVNLATFVSLILLLGVLYIPFFQGIFQITTLTSTEFLSIVALSSLVLVAGELYKKLQK
jgi:Ca2+-transporting ATPase